MTKFLNISTDDTLGGNSPSDEVVSSQKALKTYIDNHSGGGSVAIDNSTITKNLSDEIQAVATVNANTAVGATNPVYDWVGTLAEYTAQAVATNHPDWICYITDDEEADAYEAYTKTQSNNLFVAKGHEVIEFQAPTAGNNYTWYRKYADGWVEQGGRATINSVNATQVSLSVSMANTSYYVNTQALNTGSTIWDRITAQTASNFTVAGDYSNGSFIPVHDVYWEVKGMAA